MRVSIINVYTRMHCYLSRPFIHAQVQKNPFQRLPGKRSVDVRAKVQHLHAHTYESSHPLEMRVQTHLLLVLAANPRWSSVLNWRDGINSRAPL
jgi:hypothetical protein